MADFFAKIRMTACRATRALFGVVLLLCAFSTTNSFATGYVCSNSRQYNSCSSGYFMTYGGTSVSNYNGSPRLNNACTICPVGYRCSGGTSAPVAGHGHKYNRIGYRSG